MFSTGFDVLTKNTSQLDPVTVAAILITCAQSFSDNKHEVNCGRAIRARAASSCTCETKRRRHSFKLSGGVTLEVFPMGKSLELGSLWVTFIFAVIIYSDKLPKGKKKLEPRFVGNMVVDRRLT